MPSRFKHLKKRWERPYTVYNRIEISRAAVRYNLSFFRHHTGMTVIPVLKSNAYGHGIQQVATALKEQAVPYVAVDGYFEALKVQAVSKQPVLVMGMIRPENFSKLRIRRISFVVQDEATIHALGKLHKKVNVHLEINTGMNRYGISTTELKFFANLLQKYPNIELEGVMTHLADADGTNDNTVTEAVGVFDVCMDQLLAAGFRPKFLHVGQSAGSLRVKSRHANTVRIGIGLYGINPFPATHPLHNVCRSLRPALRLISTISKIQHVQKGDQVSYNYTFTAPKSMRIGILPLGYHEGVQRALSNKGVVRVGKKFQPIVGRVCMNHTIIDLESTNAQVGDEVIVYSNKAQDENSIGSIAAHHGLFAYSLLTDLSPDVRRYLVE